MKKQRKKSKLTKSDGSPPQNMKPKFSKEVRSDGNDDSTADVEKINKKPSPSSSIMTRQETSDLIAELSESILEDPTKAFSSSGPATGDTGKKDSTLDDPKAKKEPSMMRQLLQIASDFNRDEYISQLAILSLLALFRDLLPAYRIRLPSAAEMSVKVSKETKTLWDYERALLTHYQQFLKLLERIWDKSKKQKTPSTLAVTSILCLCELLKTAFHFNFRSNLLTMVLRQINNQREQVSIACCSAVEHVFENDAQGEVALEAARLLSKAIKDRGFKIRARVLRTFLKLPLRVHVDEAQAAKLATAARKRKRDKDLAEIERELAEGDATVDKIKLARCQSDTLQSVTLTYFRILKSDNLNESFIEDLLPAALEGLARYAHLINIDTVTDLLAVLKDLLKRIDALPLEAALNCVLTAFQTLEGPGREMQIDQKEYITPLYSQLPRLCTESCGERSTESLLKCLDAAFIKRREYSTVRVAAFIKQIFSVAMFSPPVSSVPLLAFGRQLLQRYPSAHSLLENEEDAITSGQYRSFVEDPEQANPFSTSAWELATLRFHIHPAVEQQASGAATLKMLQMPVEDPDRLRADGLRDANELYIKFRKTTKRHPLEPRGSDNKKRQRLRFVNPSSRSLDHLASKPMTLL